MPNIGAYLLSGSNSAPNEKEARNAADAQIIKILGATGPAGLDATLLAAKTGTDEKDIQPLLDSLTESGLVEAVDGAKYKLSDFGETAQFFLAR
jgi:predicted transcriptional regulator